MSNTCKMCVASLTRRFSSETFRIYRQTRWASRPKSRSQIQDVSSLALYRRRIPNQHAHELKFIIKTTKNVKYETKRRVRLATNKTNFWPQNYSQVWRPATAHPRQVRTKVVYKWSAVWRLLIILEVRVKYYSTFIHTVTNARGLSSEVPGIFMQTFSILDVFQLRLGCPSTMYKRCMSSVSEIRN